MFHARQPSRLLVCALLVTLGCRHSSSISSTRKERQIDARHAITQATHIAYPDVEDPGLPVDEFVTEPRRLRNERPDEIWDLSLAETIHLALANSQLIRSNAAFLSPGNPILANANGAPSTFDPAIQETGVLFGQRGVEAALSDFDAQFTSSLIFGGNEAVQNNLFDSGGLAPGQTLDEETGQFSAGLRKRMANGAQMELMHNWNYSSNNSARLFPSVYEGVLRAQYRHPLLAGGGVEYNRVAGPISTNIQGVTGVQQGVIIARINNDIALADFELSVHNLLRDVETLYWQLHLAYRMLDLEERLLEDTAEAWQIVDERNNSQGPGGGAAEYADARDLWFETKGRVLSARDHLYTSEAKLRRVLGLPVNDGRIIRPIDEPVSAELLPDWGSCLCDALALRPELRQQKWSLKSLELQLDAAQNLTLPRLDLVGGYQMNGFGDDLTGPTAAGPPGRHLGSAYETLLQGEQDGWNVGLEFSIPVGRRFALAQLRNMELRVAKAHAVLQEQEREISHEVAATFRALDKNWLMARNAYNRWSAANDRYEALSEQYLVDSRRTTVDMVLRSRHTLAEAELGYISALVEYNGALMDLHYRTGRLLHVNGVSLAEGTWTGEAAIDRNRQTAARHYSRPAPLLRAEPEEFASPPASVQPTATSEGQPSPPITGKLP